MSYKSLQDFPNIENPFLARALTLTGSILGALGSSSVCCSDKFLHHPSHRSWWDQLCELLSLATPNNFKFYCLQVYSGELLHSCRKVYGIAPNGPKSIFSSDGRQTPSILHSAEYHRLVSTTIAYRKLITTEGLSGNCKHSTRRAKDAFKHVVMDSWG